MNIKHESSLLTIKSPRFICNQDVYFIGGKGIVKNYFFDVFQWIYVVEMPLGPQPEMGRIGAETRILLAEIEIQAVSES